VLAVAAMAELAGSPDDVVLEAASAAGGLAVGWLAAALPGKPMLVLGSHRSGAGVQRAASHSRSA
jgi:hypothetical protein